jgi:hypothetical protein
MKRKGFMGELPHVFPLDMDFGGLDEEAIETALHIGNEHHENLLFGHIPPERVIRELGQVGLVSAFEQKGYTDLKLEIERLSPFEESMRLWAQHEQGRDYLFDLRAHWGQLMWKPEHFCKALVWDWVELRNPFGEFHMPPLPGQTKPGLKLFNPLVELMLRYVRETDAECLVAVPQYFHNAIFYAKAKELKFRFLDCTRQGELVAQQRDLLAGDKQCLSDTSWAFEQHRILKQVEEDSEEWVEYSWKPGELVFGLTAELGEFFKSPDQLEAIAHAARCKFRKIDPPDS